MSPSHEPIKPVSFEAATPAADTTGAEPTTAGAAPRPPWMLPALGGLALLALIVVFWLPSAVSPPELSATTEQPVSEGGTTGNSNTAVKPGNASDQEEASPWNDAQLAKLRKAAQDVLSSLLEIQFDLQERGVEQWAGAAFEQATALAQTGDQQYKSREFEQARASYEQALAAMEALQFALPEAVNTQLAAASQALEDGEVEELAAALDLARVIEPENPALPGLEQRARTLPQLLALLEQASQAEANDDLAQAEALLQQASKLDPQHQRSATELARVSADHLEYRFNKAMSEGYAALDAGRFDSASKAFNQAGALQPGSSEVTTALQEAATAKTVSQLAQIKTSGARQEAAEDWQSAVKSYEKALAMDSNVLYAREGLSRARLRAQLDTSLSKVIQQPERLSNVAVAKDSEALLQQARNIRPQSKVLNQQISALEQLLVKANQPIQVVLRSDSETEVIVYKVARLGRFEQKQLTLRPGTYTAVGTRNGYRDVRRTFVINHQSSPPTVTVACTEQI
jgi:tetratricopeptide (TPR) repeat protein